MSDHDAGPPPSAGAAEATAGGTPPSAWRLTYSYDSSGVRLVAQQRVAMVAPQDDSDLTAAGRAGYWVELRDDSGEALYRQVITDPFRHTAEVHSPLPGTASTHVPTVDVAGAFQVVVPDLPGAHEVVLHGLVAPGGSPDAPRRSRAARAERAVAQPLLVERLGETPPFEVS
jgi:hypothetical protein